MDLPVDTPRRPTDRRRRMVRWIAGGLVVLAALVGLCIWWFFKDDAPAEVSLDAATAAIAEEPAASADTQPAVAEATGHHGRRGRSDDGRH